MEYAYSFLATARLVLRARRQGRFDVLQACNPPDIFWPIARWLRRRDGSRFVFDHHDLCPELYDSRFPQGRQLPRRGLVALERATFRTADHVVATNASYAEIALRRGDKSPADVTVVRTGPDPERLRRRATVPALRRGRRHLVAYIGVMGPQDGVDLAVRAAAYVVHDLDREDVSFTFMGAGDCYDEIVALRDALGLQDYVELPGRVPDETVIDVLSTADVGLSPDPKNPLNDVSTMNKTLEYMAFGMPVVAFDLKETRVSANGAGCYVASGDVAAYARAIVELLDDDEQARGHGPGRTPAYREGARLAAPARRLCRRLRPARRAHPHGRPADPIPRCEADMCGVAGAFCQPDGARLVRTMTDRIGHRGPDADGLEDLSPHAPLQLAHRRLSIIDLSAAADQPFVKDGLHLSYNGELYNYRDLRASLQSRGVRFVTESDTEVVLESWREWGPDALSRFRGMFAFAIYDEHSGALALARDPLGIKPMYVMPRGSGVLFASELKALVAAVGPELTIDPGALVASTMFYFLPEEQSADQRRVQTPTRVVGGVAN